MAEIRAAGDPLTLADLAPKPVPAENNAATYLRRAQAGTDAIYKEAEAVPGFWEYFNTKDPMPAEIQKALKAAFTAYPYTISLFQQAAACPDYDAQLDYTDSPRELFNELISVVEKIRNYGRVLQFRVRLDVAEGNYDEAARTTLLLFRLAHHCERNPAITGYLVAVTIQGIAVDYANSVLQAGPVSKGVREALDTELARQERMEGYTWALKSDRVLTLGNFVAVSLSTFLVNQSWDVESERVGIPRQNAVSSCPFARANSLP